MLDFSITEQNTNKYLINNERVFLQSKNINVFPCSRRGQYESRDLAYYYDPEARLNTERTNRLNTAINGYKDSFLLAHQTTPGTTTTENLVFVLAGYYFEIKDFSAAAVADALGITDGKIYVHLSLHTGISLDVPDYYTEILYRQSTKAADEDKKYQYNHLDVTYSKGTLTDDFFVGVSFTKEVVTDIINTQTGSRRIPSYNLPLFAYNANNKVWDPIQTSLLPKVDHDELEDSVIVGELHAWKNIQVDGYSNINKYLNVGQPIDTTIEKGNIVASNNIISENDIIAKNDITAEQTITAKHSLQVPEVFDASAATKKVTITAENGLQVTQKGLLVTNSTLNTQTSVDILEADSANIGDLTVMDGMETKDGYSKGTVTAVQVSADKIMQNGAQVPVISLGQVSENGTSPDVWQLQFTHVIKKPKI